MSDAAATTAIAGGRTSIQLPDGRSLDVWQAGPPDGEPVVFHHGTPGAGMPFDPQVAAMAERGLRYVSWTRPGYGSSSRRRGRNVADDADDATAVLDHLGIDRAWTIGWSGGGPHALGFAAGLPDRVRGVALMASIAPWGAEGLDWTAGMGKENVDELEFLLAGEEAVLPLVEQNWPAFRDVTAEGIAAALGDLVDDVDRAAIAGGMAEYLAALSHEGLRESYLGWVDEDLIVVRPWGFDLDAIRCPVHVWQGAHDRMVPYGHGEWLAQRLPTACPHLLEEHGHLSIGVELFPEILDELLAPGG